MSATWIPLGGAPASAVIPCGTALPASANDGDQYILVDNVATPSYAWKFQWVAGVSDAYKWVFIGGSSVETEVAPNETTSSTVYVDLATVGPQLTVPRAGIYIIEFNVGMNSATVATGAGNQRWVAPKLGAAATSDADGAGGGDSSTASSYSSIAGFIKRTLAAGDLVKLQYRQTAGGSNVANFQGRRLRITPVRVS